jgi:hypothetical protein
VKNIALKRLHSLFPGELVWHHSKTSEDLSIYVKVSSVLFLNIIHMIFILRDTERMICIIVVPLFNKRKSMVLTIF